jgi:hypothetical protein
MSKRMAIHAALLEADAQGIVVESTPIVTRRRVPIPLLGPKTGFQVRFDRARHIKPPVTPSVWD